MLNNAATIITKNIKNHIILYYKVRKKNCVVSNCIKLPSSKSLQIVAKNNWNKMWTSLKFHSAQEILNSVVYGYFYEPNNQVIVDNINTHHMSLYGSSVIN